MVPEYNQRIVDASTLLSAFNENIVNVISFDEVISLSQYFIHQGSTTNAVKLICEGILVYIKKEKIDIQECFTELEWPDIGARIVVEPNFDAKVEYTKSNFVAIEAATYLEFAITFSKLYSDSKERNLASLSSKIRIAYYNSLRWFILKILWLSESGINRINPNLNQKCKTLAICFFVTIRYWCYLKGRTRLIHSSSLTIATLLKEPISRARSIYRLSDQYQELKRSNEQSLNSTKKYRRSFRSRFVWRHEDEFSNFIQLERKPFIAVTMHFGYPTSTLMRLNEHCRKGSTILALVQAEMSAAAIQQQKDLYFENDIDFDQVISDQLNLRSLVANLRRGNTYLNIYFDLPPSFGESVEVDFMGQKAQFSKGPAEIAIFSKLKICPIFSYSVNGTNYIEAHNFIDSSLLVNENFDQATRRITQELVCLGERYIVKYPEQWQFIRSMSNFFVGNKGMNITNS